MASMMKEDSVDDEEAPIYTENPTEMKQRKDEEGRVKIMKDVLANVELTISEMKELKGIIASKKRMCEWGLERNKFQMVTQSFHGRRTRPPQLPNDALDLIFSSLSTKDVLSSRLVRQNWRQVATMELRKGIRKELSFCKDRREETQKFLEVMKKSQLLPVTSITLNMKDAQDKDFHLVIKFFEIFGPVMESLCVDFMGCAVDPTSFVKPLKMYLDGIQLEKLLNLTIILRENKVPSVDNRASLISAYFRCAQNLENISFHSEDSSVILTSLEISPLHSHLSNLFLETVKLIDNELENLGRVVKLKRLSLKIEQIGFKSETMKGFLQSQSKTLEYLRLFPYDPSTEFIYEFPMMENVKILSIEGVKKNQILRFARMDWNESFPKLKELKMRGRFEEHWMDSLFPSDTTPAHLVKRLDFPIGIRRDVSMNFSVVSRIFPNIETIKLAIEDLVDDPWDLEHEYLNNSCDFNLPYEDPFLSDTFPNMKKIVLRSEKDFFTELRFWKNNYEREDAESSEESLMKNYLKKFAWVVVLNPGIKRSCEQLTTGAFEIKFDLPSDAMGPRFVRKTFDCTWFLRLLRERVRLQELSDGNLDGRADGGCEITLSLYNLQERCHWMNTGSLAEIKAVIAEEFRFRRNPIEWKRREENERGFKLMKRIVENLPLMISEIDELRNILVEKERSCDLEADWIRQMESRSGEGDLPPLPNLILEKIFSYSSLSTKDILSSRLVCRHWWAFATKELRKRIRKEFTFSGEIEVQSKDLKGFLEVMKESQLLPVSKFHISCYDIQDIEDSEEMNLFQIFAPTLTHLNFCFAHSDFHKDFLSDYFPAYLKRIQLKKLEELRFYFNQQKHYYRGTDVDSLRTLLTSACFGSGQYLRKLKFEPSIHLCVLLDSLQNAPLPHLHTLSLSVHDLMDKDLESLGLVVKLKSLSLTIHHFGFKSVTTETIKRFLESQSKTLEYLKLGDFDEGNLGNFVYEFPIMTNLRGLNIRYCKTKLRFTPTDWNTYFPKLQELKLWEGFCRDYSTEWSFRTGTKSKHFGVKILDFTRGFGLGMRHSNCLPVIGQVFPNVHTVRISAPDFLNPILLNNFLNLKKIIFRWRYPFSGEIKEESENRVVKFVWDMNLDSPLVKDYITRLTESGVEIKEYLRCEGGDRKTYGSTDLLPLFHVRIKLEQLDEELTAEVETKKILADLNLDSDDEDEQSGI